MKNERGSALVLVLLVIIVFTVLGVSLMTQVLTENKLSVRSEKEMQARNLAESGLVYFEKDFMSKLDHESESVDIDSLVNSDYGEEKIVIGEDTPSEQAKIIKVDKEKGTDFIRVHSKGIVDSAETTVIGIYELTYDEFFQKETYELADFSNKDTEGVNFSRSKLLHLGLGNLVNLDLFHFPGNDNKFYRVPDESVINLNFLEGLLKLGIGKVNRFKTMEEKNVVATREGSLLSLLALNDNARVNVLKFRNKGNANVLINGYYDSVKLLWITLASGYKDIDFKKLAVMGNAIIQQDNKDDDPRRYFSFREGLYVNQSLVIGDNKNGSNVGVIGDIVVMENLGIHNVNLEVGAKDNSKYKINNPEDAVMNIYVHGDVHIKNSCIQLKEGYDLRIYTKGKITFENKSKCNIYPGFYYAEDGFDFKTLGHSMKINGSILYGGDKKVDFPNMLEILGTEKSIIQYKKSGYNLIPMGREFE